MKATILALTLLGVNNFGVLALPVTEISDVTDVSVEALQGDVELVTRDDDNGDNPPFSACLLSGKSWKDCGKTINLARRDDDNGDNPPFSACLQSGKNWNQCQQGISKRQEESELESLEGDSDVILAKRDSTTNFDGIVNELGRGWGGQSNCYDGSSNKHHWLTNTAVRKISQSACQESLKSAAQGGIGISKKKTGGFYDGNAGPIVKSGVTFVLSTWVRQRDGVNFDLNTVAKDLCVKGIDHLAGDKGCTTAKKVGKITEHTAVNPGSFQWTIDGKAPEYDSDDCTNCILDVFFES